MNHDPIERAKARIAYHESEIKRLRDFIATAEAILNEPLPWAGSPAKPEMASQAPESLGLPSEVLKPVALPQSRFAQSSPTFLILKEAEDLFKIEGKSTSASDIYEKLIRRGIKIAGKNPKGNLTAKFATKKDIFSYEKDTGLWSLTEWTKAKTNEAPAEQSESASKPESGGTANTDMFS